MKQKSFTRLVSGLLMGTILVAFALTAAMSNYYIRQNLIENAIETGQRNVKADDVSLSAYLSFLGRSSRELYYNTGIYTVLYEPSHNYEDSASIFTYLQSLVNLSDGREILQIYMNLYSSGKSYLVGRSGRAIGDGDYQAAIPESLGPYQAFCEGVHLSHTYDIAALETEAAEVCTFHWNIYNTMGTQVIGTLSIDVLIDKLASYLSSVERGNPVYLLSEEGTVLYQNTDVLSESAQQELLQKNTAGWMEIRDSSFQGVAFVQKVSSDLVSWRIVELKTNEELFGPANQILLWQILLMAVAALICIGVAVLTIFHLMKPLRELKNYAKAVEKGNLTADIRQYTHYQRPDEIGALIVHMENMMATVNEMFIRQQKLSQAHRNVEMKMLLAQINPHFIYNTLQSISTLALMHGDKESYRLLVRLGAEMQYSMNLEQEVVKLQQEKEYIENYLVLQQQRFDGRFQFEILLEPGTESITVPKMSLQPLVENAIKHGKIHQIPGGFIRVRAKKVEETLEITLEDNGKGCSEERYKELNEILANPREEDVYVKEHIGMRNVNYRLRLLYGEKVRMILGPSIWNGGKVTIRIPLDQYEGGPIFESIDCR
ncbi:sensor histidine kinase [Hominifimenecus sp. rT4P-3]|uniref:sensor histidine kinase n=1 Tax=Hominifimenecus sp. rT4P-3 TaxID=3242979 RepID=UPI003DA277BD